MSTQTGPRDGVATEVERIDLAQWQADASRWRGQRPVVIAGAFADTAAVTTWTPESLAERFPDLEVKARHTSSKGWGDASRVKFEPMTMARFVSLVREGRPLQLTEQALERTEGLYGELDIPRAVAPPHWAVNLWIGNQTSTPLHFDLPQNLFVQVYGTKRFILEPPSSPAHRYMQGGRAAHISQVDPLAHDAVRFPKYRPDHQRIALVGAGDALHIPSTWFHHVTALDTSISVNCWYAHPFAPAK